MGHVCDVKMFCFSGVKRAGPSQITFVLFWLGLFVRPFDYLRAWQGLLKSVVACVSHVDNDRCEITANLREHSFFRRGGWAGGIQGRVINFLPAQKGRVSINLTQQRGGVT